MEHGRIESSYRHRNLLQDAVRDAIRAIDEGHGRDQPSSEHRSGRRNFTPEDTGQAIGSAVNSLINSDNSAK